MNGQSPLTMYCFKVFVPNCHSGNSLVVQKYLLVYWFNVQVFFFFFCPSPVMHVKGISISCNWRRALLSLSLQTDMQETAVESIVSIAYKFACSS